MALTKTGTDGIKDDAITLDKLAHGTSSQDGKFLRANNGSAPSFETVSIPAGTTINNNADNRVITGSGTANTLNAESDVVIDSSGRMGIGLTPSSDTGYMLQLGSGGSQTFMTFATSGSGVGALNGLVVGNDTSRAYFTQRENQPIHIATNNTDRVVIDENGKLNIGTDLSDSTMASVAGLVNIHTTNTGTHNGLTLFWDHNNTTTDIEQRIQFSLGDNASDDQYINAGYIGIGKADTWQGNSVRSSYLSFATSNASTQAERMRIDSSGRVGIGATSFNDAAEYLLVKNDGTAANVSIVASNDAHSSLNLGDEDDFNIQKIKSDHTDNSLQFFTNNAERMRIDSSGKLGLGTHTGVPNTKVDIGLGVFAATGVDHDASDWGTDVFQLTATGGNAAQNQVLLVGCHSGGVGQIGSGIGFGRNSTTDWGTYLSFKTHPTSTSNIDQLVEHMRINAHGFVKMKGDMSDHMSADGNNYHEMQADNPNIQILNMKHGSSNGYGIMMQLAHNKATHWAHRVYNYANGQTRMYIRADGDLENTNNSYGSTSDIKLKENIVDASSQWNDVKALRVRNFNYKADENKTKFLGLVAQEAETVCPSLVKEQPDTDAENKDLGTTTKFLKYSILYMKAFKALQEAMAKIETLETKVAALEAA